MTWAYATALTVTLVTGSGEYHHARHPDGGRFFPSAHAALDVSAADTALAALGLTRFREWVLYRHPGNSLADCWHAEVEAAVARVSP